MNKSFNGVSRHLLRVSDFLPAFVAKREIVRFSPWPKHSRATSGHLPTPGRKAITRIASTLSLFAWLMATQAFAIVLSEPEVTDWRYNVCECDNFSNAYQWSQDCKYLDGGTWVGGNPLRCIIKAHPRPWPSESFIEPKVSAREGGKSATLLDWLSPGEINFCQYCGHKNNSVHFKLGVEDRNHARVQVQDSVDYEATRSRDVSCPAGFTVQTVFLKERCVLIPDQCNGPSAGNPITCGSGNKRQSETDYTSSGTSPLRFTRTYNSYGYYRPEGPLETPTASLGNRWRHTYDRYVTSAANPDALATVVRPDGDIKTFDQSGNELESPSLRTERLEKLIATDGSPDGWRYSTAQNEIEIYDAEGKLLSITDRRGVIQTLHYSDTETPPDTAPHAGLLLGVEDSFGRRLSFTYHHDGLLASMTDPAGSIYTYNYDHNNYYPKSNLIEVTFPDDSAMSIKRTYHYENSQFPYLLTGITDENGVRYATYAYDGAGRAISTEYAGDVNKYSLIYGGNGSRTLTDPLGESRALQYQIINGVRRFIGSTQPCTGCGGSSSAGTKYDTDGRITESTDFNGNTTSYIRNEVGLEISRTEAVGTPDQRTTTTIWHPTLYLPIEINEPGRKQQYSYDSTGNRLNETITDTATSETRTTSYTYNDLGLLHTSDGPRTDVSDITTNTYDAQGNLLSVTNALGHLTQITAHDAHGNPVTLVDPNGVVTELTYDARQRLTSRNIDGAVTQFEYDAVGQLIKLTQPNGAFIGYEYDAAHRLVALEDGLGNRIEYTLDAMGNRIKEEVFDPDDVLRRKQSRVFNELSRLKEIQGANGQLTEYQYDANGNRTAVTEAGLFSTLSQFDVLNRLNKVTDANNGESTYTYDALDRLTSVTDAKGLTTTYSYNAFGDLVRLSSPDTGVSTYSYDKAGNRLRQTDARGITVNHSYDALNRLRLTDYPGTLEDVTYHYDGDNYSSSIANGVGRLTGVENGSESASMTYDNRGNLLTDTRNIAGKTFTTQYQYDQTSQLTRMTYPSGRVVNFNRNSIGQVTDVLSSAGNNAQAIITHAAYRPFGSAQTLVYGNGATRQTDVDLDYRISSLNVTGSNNQPVLARTYTYDARDNITAIRDLIEPAQSQDFIYDLLARLAGAGGAYGRLEYHYDAIGNRTRKTRNGVADAYQYDGNSHHLKSVNTTAFSYDASGNQTAKGELQMSYNSAGRLNTVSDDGKVLYSATYNALGQRVSKTVGNRTHIFIYNDEGQLIAEGDGQRGIQKEYLYLNGQPVALFDGNKQYSIHTDHLGTPQVLTDQRGKIAWAADFLPFGQASPQKRKPVFNLRFPGQYYDEETGMHYNYFRDYDPEIGRYIESDPIGLAGGINTYLYANANPVRYFDQYGLKTCGSGWNEPFVPDNPLGYKFSSCCEAHDNCYGTCGMNKASCDNTFLECLLSKCKKYHPTCKWAAKQYYNAVMKYGKSAYDAAQKTACTDCSDPK